MVSDSLQDCSPLSEPQPALQQLCRFFFSVYCICLYLIYEFCSLLQLNFTISICLLRKPRYIGFQWPGVTLATIHTQERSRHEQRTLDITFNSAASSYLTPSKSPSDSCLLTGVCYWLWIRFNIYSPGTAPQKLSTETLWPENIGDPNARSADPAAERAPHATGFQHTSKTRLVLLQMKPCPQWAGKP